MALTELTALGATPDPTDADTFDQRAENTIDNLAQAVLDYNANVPEFNSLVAQAANAIAAGNATVWTSGEAITEGDGRYSPTDYQSYRAKNDLTTGQNVNDPSTDATNWEKLSSSYLPEIKATSSGALANGDKVIVNSDGTVSVVAGNTNSVGAASVFESAASLWHTAAYDTNAQKVVIAYRDAGNSNQGTAVVGTVSGSSISFGTPVVFEAGDTTEICLAYDTNAQKVVVAFRDNSNVNKGTAIVGTVSGTSISFGTAVVFQDSNTQKISIAYDSTSQQVVIAYQNFGNSSYGTAIVGAVSGTSISFGTGAVFESAATNETSVAYDSNTQKIVISYQDSGNSNYGTAIVGTVSGTSISFGTAVVFESATCSKIKAVFDTSTDKVVIAYYESGSAVGKAIVGTVSGTSISFGSAVTFNSAGVGYIGASYDAGAGKVVIVYQDTGNSSYGTAIAGKVSGTSISFGTEIVFESATSSHVTATYDSTSEQVVIAYTDEGNSSYGTAILLTTEATNLTEENYIGISDAAYSDAALATIQTIGAVDDAQSGLTAGQKYYVQGVDGSLSTTPDDLSVFAGTALSATELLIKG